MKIKFYDIFKGLMILLLFYSCKKDKTTDDFPPTISFISISPDTVIQFQDSVIIKIRYEDQNGDIGFNDPDEPVIWVKDSRLTDADLFHVQPLTPNEENLSIYGTLYIRLKAPFLLGNGNIEPVSFSIKLRDRSNLWSETIETNTIIIIRE